MGIQQNLEDLPRNKRENNFLMIDMESNKENMESNKEKIKEILQNDSRFAIGAMLFIQKNNQTLKEQIANQTEEQEEQNGIGFNQCDAEILRNFSGLFEKYGYLSNRQIEIIHKYMPKYWSQLQNQVIFPNGNMKRKAPITRFKIPCQILKSEPDPKPIQEEQLKTEKKQEFNPKNAKLTKDLIQIRFPYNPTTIAQIKTLTGRRFNADNYSDKHWTTPLSMENIQKLIEFGFSINKKLSSWLNQEKEKYSPPKSIEAIPGFKRIPYPFQKEGIEFIEARHGRALIADEMGLGKTIQALGWLQLHSEIRPVVIIVPASLKLNWEREIQNSLSKSCSVFIASGKKPGGKIKKAKKADIIIINYDILTGWTDFIVDKIHPKVIIMDESHYIKNGKALRTKATKRICKKVKNVIALTGTPITNKPVEIYNILNILNPNLFPNFMAFALKHCDAKNNGYGWDFNGASNTEELHKILTNTIMIRRKKADVLRDLPAKVRSIVPMEITDRNHYKKAMKEFQEWLEQNEENPAEAMVRLEKTKFAAAKGKMKAAINWIRDFLESGEKLVVFTTHNEIINGLQEEFKEISVKVSGSTTGKDRQKAVDEFQGNKKIRLFLGNIKAAGVGITLTAASNTCFLELAWTPAEHEQAEDRIHRIGQKSDSVNAWYLIAKDTIEEDIIEMLDKKAKILSAVLDGKKIPKDNLLLNILNKIRKGE